ncbi:Choline-sulfatase [Candidatus Rhodobacter oscarellae]|uniref:Choline-sulfatase n=2 Tax=Candidatus Rhodobacter oscarellae TaxID=1675527 RepID=A0A0J9GUS4_9RHOB|nr:Choline-sulfatase [Candidatus Rhodobacter lobularis]
MVFLLFDSLVRDLLPQYGGDPQALPNFARLDARCGRFDNHFVGSLPCMPARRDLHNGRLNFFHRHWGPLEPFDDSFVSTLRDSGVYTHLITDHYHYFEEGGWSFHTRYNSWELFRGQESDVWRGTATPIDDDIVDRFDPDVYDLTVEKYRRHAINRAYIRDEAEFSSHQSFTAALKFLDENQTKDDWLLHLEVFDPHEPFHAPMEFLKAEGIDPNDPIADWPAYGAPEYDARVSELLRKNYRALLRFCDKQLGRLLDAFDAQGLWEDTALVLTTDHGFMLSEHGYWGKSVMPLYNQISQIPMFLHMPGTAPGAPVKSLSQTTDIAPTILDAFGAAPSKDMTGRSLVPACKSGETGRDIALFGIWGGPLNCTDGRYVFFIDPDDPAYRSELFIYSLMPVDVKKPLEIADLQRATQHPPFDFTKQVPVWKIPSTGVQARGATEFMPIGSMLFDLDADPEQLNPILGDHMTETRLRAAMQQVLVQHDAPPEVLTRFSMSEVRSA